MARAKKVEEAAAESGKDRKMSVGQVLKTERESRKLSIGDITDGTKIRESYIQAMEADKFDQLPGAFYIKAYIKTYAEFLELDEDQKNALLGRKRPRSANNDNGIPEPYKDEFSPSPLIIIACIVLAVGAYFGWMEYQKWQQDETAPVGTQEVVEEVKPLQQQVLELFTNPDPAITIVAGREAKVTVSKPNGDVIFDKRMDIGDTYFVPEEKGLILSSDAMESLEVYVDAQKVTSFDNLDRKANGGIVLDVQKLLAGISVKQ